MVHFISLLLIYSILSQSNPATDAHALLQRKVCWGHWAASWQS